MRGLNLMQVLRRQDFSVQMLYKEKWIICDVNKHFFKKSTTL